MMKAKGLLGLLCLAAAGVASARTVALWPLEATATGGFDGRCVIDSANDLNVRNFVLTDSDLGWDLPPRPDAAPHPWNPVNAKAVEQVVNDTDGAGFLDNDTTGVYVARDRDFTLEGWIKLRDLPARGQWSCLASGFRDVGSRNRWTFSLRRRESENYACTWIVWAEGGSDQVVAAYPSEEASYDLTNKWMHVALTHRAYVADKDTWTVFIDGVQVGSSVQLPGTAVSGETPRFDLGARIGASNPTYATFDYWRLSDRILAPSEFLCAGESGTQIPVSHTVAYWPLEATADGGVDGRDAVGDSPLTSGFQGTTARYNRMSPAADCAFQGNPPNPTVSLPDGNAGCLQGTQSSGCLVRDDLGASLNLSTNFTVEGWFAPRLCERADKTASNYPAYLFGTRPDMNKGWVLAYRPKSATDILFDIYCLDGEGSNMRNNVKLSGTYPVAQWYETWHHLALVYEADGGANGYGLWSLYIDGELTGTTENGSRPVPVTDERVFFLGGRAEVAGQSFQGKIDCVRVSQAALRPSQLLCATENAEAATDVLAFWPLNVEGGAYLDLRDVSGNNRHFASRDSEWNRQKATGDRATPGPVIRNPDRTPNFRGSRTKMEGSVRFRDPDAAQDMDRAYLATGSTTVTEALRGGQDSTLEFYYMRRSHVQAVNSDSQEVFLTLADGSSVSVRFFRTSNGFYIWENRNGDVPDTLFAGTSDADMAVDIWYHVALVHAFETWEGVRKTVWRLYVDGTLKGTVSADSNASTLQRPTVLFGGRYWRDRNSVLGNLSSMRLSAVALDPSEFLCAEPAGSGTDDEPSARAYWPIDAGADGLADRLSDETPLVATGTAAEQTDQARAAIPNSDALTILTGSARRNAGSYALSDGALVASGVGHHLSFASPFTVEGWVKWPEAGTDTEDLFTVGEADSGKGVRVSLDRTGTVPRLHVFARAAWPSTPLVDATFDADLTPLLGVWTHLAITYDPCAGTGMWTLYADGVKLGASVSNFWRANGVDYFRDSAFRIGPATASVDMWRVSTGVWDTTKLLWARPTGMLFIVR
ncbi:MAG: LamG-like jellyroll fold domain-containing protein [Kiritimatiellia bacterium]